MLKSIRATFAAFLLAAYLLGPLVGPTKPAGSLPAPVITGECSPSSGDNCPT